MGDRESAPGNVKPISLHPLSVEQALRKAMSASAEPQKPTTKKRRNKKKKRKS